MNKVQYLSLLKDVLAQNDVPKEERDVILEDYEEMYEGYENRGMTDKEIKKKLGSPYNVVASLKGTMHYERSVNTTGEKFIAISPFLALIIFFIFGFLYDTWHPAWLVFFIIPVSAIIIKAKETLSVMLVALMPFIATTFFILYGYYTGVYHPTWIVFLVIIFFAFAIMKEPRKYLYMILLIISSALYLYVGEVYGVYDVSLLLFVPLVGIMIYFKDIELKWDVQGPTSYVLLATLVIYVLGGYFFDLWAVLWLIFFIIPLYAIFNSNETSDTKIISYTPFIATTIFYLLGYYFGVWHLSWMAFLLIPMVGILKGDSKK